MSYRITLIPGDGIGPEIVDAARQVIDASGLDMQWQQAPAGQSALDTTGNPLPDGTLEAVQSAHATLKGPTATPSGTGFRSVNVALRQKLELFANYRPARSLPGIKTRFEDVDLIVIRENTEGLYSGLEHTVVTGGCRKSSHHHRKSITTDRQVCLRYRPASKPITSDLRSQSKYPQTFRRALFANLS